MTLEVFGTAQILVVNAVVVVAEPLARHPTGIVDRSYDGLDVGRHHGYTDRDEFADGWAVRAGGEPSVEFSVGTSLRVRGCEDGLDFNHGVSSG